jgi:hypothetical protein
MSCQPHSPAARATPDLAAVRIADEMRRFTRAVFRSARGVGGRPRAGGATRARVVAASRELPAEPERLRQEPEPLRQCALILRQQERTLPQDELISRRFGEAATVSYRVVVRPLPLRRRYRGNPVVLELMGDNVR